MGALGGYPRSDGRVGARNHVLVLPAVVCATRVAKDIARAAGAATITHQHGCSQVGDDATRTGTALESVAAGPNVCAVLVIGLGCETLQGRRLASRIEARGQRTAFVGIQESGGSEPAVSIGTAEVTRLVREAHTAPRGQLVHDRLVIGIEASAEHPLLPPLVATALEHGVAVLAGDGPAAAALSSSAVHVDAYGVEASPRPGALTILRSAGVGPQQHVALAGAGVQVIVSFPGPGDGPVGFPVCPVVSVQGGSPLHAALASDFDVLSGASASELWHFVLDVIAGCLTAAERSRSAVFALERLAMTL